MDFLRKQALEILDEIGEEYQGRWQELPLYDPRIVKVRQLLGVQVETTQAFKRPVAKYKNGKFVKALGIAEEASVKLGITTNTLVSYCYSEKIQQDGTQYKFTDI